MTTEPKVEVNDWMNGKFVKIEIAGFEVLVYDNGHINYTPKDHPIVSLPVAIDMNAWPYVKEITGQ